MEKDGVSVFVIGNAVEVSRTTLANNMKQWSLVAKHLEKRPGEPTGAFPPNERHSADKMAMMVTVLNELNHQE